MINNLFRFLLITLGHLSELAQTNSNLTHHNMSVLHNTSNITNENIISGNNSEYYLDKRRLLGGSAITYSDCPISEIICTWDHVCPKVQEITHCSRGGIPGYTTYRLSLILKNDMNIRNIYAIFGERNNELYMPPSYQTIGMYNSNLGGVYTPMLDLNSNALYDSWLTIGVIGGDTGNILQNVGFDFSTWTSTTPLRIDNGAIFLNDPMIKLSNTNEYIIGQITLPNDVSDNVIINAQGKLNDQSHSSWSDRHIVFPLSKPVILQHNSVPENCVSWFDGCNTCVVNNGEIAGCTRIICFRQEQPHCQTYNTENTHLQFNHDCNNWYYQPCNTNNECQANYHCSRQNGCIASICDCSGLCTIDCGQYSGLCIMNAH
tara:strand:+ start:82 stop:1206 length:1125 start_codon:yes stop_codon:yes gene_type:complete